MSDIDKTTTDHRYAIAVVFLSNEYPWRHNGYEAEHDVKDDDAAIRWAEGMAEGLGDRYSVTLLKDGVALKDVTHD